MPIFQDKIKKTEKKLAKYRFVFDCSCVAKLHSDLKYTTRDRYQQKMAAVRNRSDFKAVAVFVTFELDITAQEMIDEFKGIIARKNTLFRNRCLDLIESLSYQVYIRVANKCLFVWQVSAQGNPRT